MPRDGHGPATCSHPAATGDEPPPRRRRPERVALSALKPDPQNRRLHTKRNIDMLAEGLRKVKAARSIVLDEDNVILAGNGVAEAAEERTGYSFLQSEASSRKPQPVTLSEVLAERST